jgi:hypothetical protein
MSRWLPFASLIVCCVLVAGATSASAQSLGPFRWRTEPYCNVVTVTVTPIGSVCVLDGFDEQCGGNPRQPVRGVAVPQVNGSITLGLDGREPGRADPRHWSRPAGEDPLRIGTIDADGIAFRAIQALEARTREEEARTREENGMLKALLAALEPRLDRLEAHKR